MSRPHSASYLAPHLANLSRTYSASLHSLHPASLYPDPNMPVYLTTPLQAYAEPILPVYLNLNLSGSPHTIPHSLLELTSCQSMALTLTSLAIPSFKPLSYPPPSTHVLNSTSLSCPQPSPVSPALTPAYPFLILQACQPILPLVLMYSILPVFFALSPHQSLRHSLLEPLASLRH